MMGHPGMVICLPYIQFVSPSIGGLTLGPIFMCVLLCLCFLAAYKYDIHRDAQLDFMELHKMSRWFVSSIILHHAQYIEWFSNHSSSPWSTGLYVWMVLPASAIKKGKKKDKKRDGCFTCGLEEHRANKCPNKYQEARTWLQICQCHSKQQWWGIWVW